jgi:hypothetical protein
MELASTLIIAQTDAVDADYVGMLDIICTYGRASKILHPLVCQETFTA